MTEGIEVDPKELLEKSVNRIYDEIKPTSRVSEVRVAVKRQIEQLSGLFTEKQMSYIGKKLPQYLKDAFGGFRGKVEDSDQMRDQAIAFLQPSFPELYHG